MVDTKRTLSALQSLLADNTSGDISAQDIRDMLVSVFPTVLSQPQGRLTTESGVAVSTSDRTNQNTLYYTPYNGNGIWLYNGTSWENFNFTERSLSLSGLTSGRNYDVFLYDNSGTLTLELSAWAGSGQAITGATNASPIIITANSHGLSNGDQVYISGVLGNTAANGTFTVANVATNTFELSGSTGSGTYTAGSGWFNARASTGLLTTQDGVLVKSGATTRRYLGTIRTTGTTTTEDSQANRFVWNNHNQVIRSLARTDSSSHSYASGTAREWNAGTASRASAVIGFPQSVIFTQSARLTSGANYVAYPSVNGNVFGTFIQLQTANTTGLGQSSSYLNSGFNYLCVFEAAFSGTATVDTGGVQSSVSC